MRTWDSELEKFSPGQDTVNRVHMLMLIERDSSSYATWPSLIQKKRFADLSVQEVVSKYQGFEGELVCFFEVKENAHEFKEKFDKCLEMKMLGNCFLLHVFSCPSEMPSFLKDQVIKLGYDVGACGEEVTLYSSIFHEVIFGYFDELVSYKDLLNENLLFPDRAIAEKYLELHNQLSAEGKSVEDYMEMVIYETWRHKELEDK